MTPLLPYLLIIVKAIKFEKVSLSVRQKSPDWFLTYWLPVRSIVFLIETIQRSQLRCNYLQKEKLFLSFFLHFWNVDAILNIFIKKDDPHSWCIFEITDHENPG